MSISSSLIKKGELVLLLICLLFLSTHPYRVEAGAYVFAGEANGIDVVTHPPNYTGTGGEITVSVCIDPVSVNAAAMVTPVKNIVSIINGFVPRTPNLIFGGSNNIPAGQFDFESLTLHEFGHCMSLHHPNQGVKTGVSGVQTEATQSTDGLNNTFNFDDGVDNIYGSGDDVRGDDANLHYFINNENNPFLIHGKYDSTNYTRDVSNLPVSDLYPANAGRTIAPTFSVTNTESVMQQGQGSDEDQRGLQADDIATLMYAGSGLDEIVGTADDYTIKAVYAGLTTSCDIVAKSDTSTGFASCAFGGSFISGTDHIRITSGLFRYNPNAVTWFFNPVLACDSMALDYAHDALIKHVACGDITTSTGFNVGSTGNVILNGNRVIFGPGTNVAGQLTVNTQ